MFYKKAMIRETTGGGRTIRGPTDTAKGAIGKEPFHRRATKGYTIAGTELYKLQLHPVQVLDSKCPITTAM